MINLDYVPERPDGKCLYRYEDPAYWVHGDSRPALRVFSVVRETERSYFIGPRQEIRCAGEEKRVPKEGRNLYAFPSEEEALVNYYFRKRKQVKILRSRLGHAEDMLEVCLGMIGEKPKPKPRL